MFSLGVPELIIFGGIAVLLFGKRLPEVARSMGKSLVEFKKGMRGIEDEFHAAANAPSPPRNSYPELDDREQSRAPKFIPPTSEPTAEARENER